jgi:hypothetical protein
MLLQVAPESINVDSILRANAPSQAFLEGALPPWTLALNLAIGTLLVLVVQHHYRNYSSTLSGQEQFARVFPYITLTTLLIITIVKSSLALSLGLVGALSIVRFRTPIKEPEELAYLFICIAIGLGLGANQIMATVGSTAFILVVTGVMSNKRGQQGDKALYLSVSLPQGESESGPLLGKLNETMGSNGARTDLRRFDLREGALEANYFVEVSNPESLEGLVNRVKKAFPGAGVSFIDQSRLPAG